MRDQFLLSSDRMKKVVELFDQLKSLTQARTVDTFGRDEELLEFLRPFFQFLFLHYFRVSLSGKQHIPKHGPAIIVANHSGTLPYDGAMLHLAVHNVYPKASGVRFLVDDFISEWPYVSDLVRRLGGIPASMANAIRLLKAEQTIAIFPEGVKGVGKYYDERYDLKPFGHGGFVRLAMKSRATIIPAAIIGAEEIHPMIAKCERLARPFGLPYIPITPTFPWLGPLGMIPLPTKWQIAFGKPLSFADAKPRDIENESLVLKKAEAIQKTIQTMISARLKKRKSVWY
ncbi:MAG: acyltransferase family protein [Deltaproteobacteria bacterium]|nr:acyltransferase family protein [Deltaproteobacteria bacterium]